MKRKRFSLALLVVVFALGLMIPQLNAQTSTPDPSVLSTPTTDTPTPTLSSTSKPPDQATQTPTQTSQPLESVSPTPDPLTPSTSPNRTSTAQSLAETPIVNPTFVVNPNTFSQTQLYTIIIAGLLTTIIVAGIALALKRKQPKQTTEPTNINIDLETIPHA